MILKLKTKTILMGILSVFGLVYSPQMYADPPATGVTGVQQANTVTGKVSDSMGPLIGATVMERGTDNGTVTDINGNFSINVSSGATLVISYVGYTTQEVPVQGRSNINIDLAEAGGTDLNEVVVIGYGTQRKEAVTGSVASMNGNTLREVQAGGITQALAGRIAGVQMMQTSSQPGADMQIRIRGTRSLTGNNDPLVVLDGIPFPGDLGDINPDDIKSIDILKDASSTAIYGSRGANGVIMITTFSGYQDMPAKVTYSGYYGFKTLYHRVPMMTGDQLYQMRKVAGKYIDTNGDPTMGTDEALGNDTDWQDLLFGDGYTTNHNINVSGGSKTGSYSFGGGYYADQSLLPGQNYKRFSLRATIDQNVGKYFRFGLTTNNNFNIANGRNMSMYNSIALSPLINPYNEDGSWKTVVHSIADNYWAFSRDAVESLGDAYADRQTGLRSYNSVFAEVKVPWIEGLSYRINIGLNYFNRNRGQYQDEGVFSDTPTAASTGSLNKYQRYSWAIEHLVTYDRTFDKHHINVVGLYSAEQTHQDGSLVSATNIPSDFFQYWNLGQQANVTVNPDDQIYEEFALQSFMGRVMYDYDNRYMISAAIRADGSSRLAPGHKWHTYPAVSAGWNIARESFMQSTTGWLDNLKLRFGWGQTSNQAVDPYSTLGSLGLRPYNFGVGNNVTGAFVETVPNALLGWEYSNTLNFGLDFSLFNGRLRGTAEYYIIKTSDILQSVTLPQSSGLSSYMANIGKSQNKGFELSLNGTIIDNVNGWTWDAGVNFYTNSNKITELASGQERDEKNGWFVGHSINSIYDYQKVGIWNESDPDFADFKTLEPDGNVGMIKVKYNGAPHQIDASDRQIMNADPAWQGGFNTRVAYKNWDLTLIGTFQHGGILVSTLHAANGYLNMLTGRRGNVDVDYWTPDNTDAKYPKPGGVQSGDNQKYGSTLGYFDSSYLKLGQLTLGYNFDAKADWFKRLGLASARIYFTAQNLFTLFSPFTDETGMDPTTNSYGNQNAAIVTDLPYNVNTMLTIGTSTPQTRNFLFGLNLSF